MQVLGALIDDLRQRVSTFGVRDALLLSETHFNRELARERIRATRRSIPFCIITVKLIGNRQRRAQLRKMLRLLHRNLRMTDQKGMLNQGAVGILLVDTSEMGGRSAMDRLAGVMQTNHLHVEMDLKVHDPDGFGPQDHPGPNDQQSRIDAGRTPWQSTPHHRPEEPSRENANNSGELTVSGGPTNMATVASEEPMMDLPRIRMFSKRALDVVGASTGLIVLSPVIAAAMLKIRMDDGGSPLFKQTREGMHGKPFTIYKLRTMVVDAEKRQAELRHQSHRDGPAFKIKHDPRITNAGRFLRRTCIDELPQLWNVLKGDMSLVGPRPLPWQESRACENWHRRRLDLRPGMTCYWQVNKANIKSFDDWMRLDLRYLSTFGVVEDARLIFQTIKVPILGRGSE
ncbi:MAG: sugar transferase [Rubripirellula sp.]